MQGEVMQGEVILGDVMQGMNGAGAADRKDERSDPALAGPDR